MTGKTFYTLFVVICLVCLPSCQSRYEISSFSVKDETIEPIIISVEEEQKYRENVEYMLSTTEEMCFVNDFYSSDDEIYALYSAKQTQGSFSSVTLYVVKAYNPEEDTEITKYAWIDVDSLDGVEVKAYLFHDVETGVDAEGREEPVLFILGYTVTLNSKQVKFDKDLAQFYGFEERKDGLFMNLSHIQLEYDSIVR